MSARLRELHTLCLDIVGKPLSSRLQMIAEFFLDTKYGPWEDGSSLESLDDFHYDLDTLDCVTFVEVVLALAKTEPFLNFEAFERRFEKILQLIHYANGQPNFISRNHFMSIDWILNNKFIVEDITNSLSDNAKVACALIDKFNWIRRHKISNGQEPQLPAKVLQSLQPQVSNVPYIETLELLNDYARFKEIFPEYSIVNIVRPNWDLTEQIGTHLNISHLGFVFKNSETKDLLFYHASSVPKKTVKLNLDEYMSGFQDSPTIKGINVLVIKPGYYAG